MLAASSLALPERATRPVFATGAMPVYAGLALAWAALPVLLAVEGLRIAADEFGIVAGALALIVWVALCVRGRGFVRVAAAIEAWVLYLAVCMTAMLLSLVLAASGHPLIDASLAQVDRAMLPGFDWREAMLEFSRSGRPYALASASYRSILWQPHLLIVVLAWTGADRRIWQFLLSWVVTLGIAVLVSGFCPAIGAYAYFGITAADIPHAASWYNPAILEGLHSGTLTVIGLGSLDGIVTFPSFHAGAAVLLGRAFWDIRWLRWPFAVLNALMLAAAVPIGGHYLIDILTGTGVAVAGLYVAARVMRRVCPPTSDS
ncbi:phosphatase PAP2 family protein [Sphingomonas sp. R86521]|uniref:phosphatase PAP2 family protein n=1 Tax=Sphingomonas sp. R86521 TaxID=3093860 RepID=UPI0036D2E2F5